MSYGAEIGESLCEQKTRAPNHIIFYTIQHKRGGTRCGEGSRILEDGKRRSRG